MFLPRNRESTRAAQDSKELWATIEANAQLALDVAAAAKARDLPEINRIIDRSNLSRQKLSFACERLGLVRHVQSGGCSNGVIRTEQGKAKTSADAKVVEGMTTPLFFLDKEGPGGMTALSLATVNDDVDTVRHLIKKVSTRRRLAIVDV